MGSPWVSASAILVIFLLQIQHKCPSGAILDPYSQLRSDLLCFGVLCSSVGSQDCQAARRYCRVAECSRGDDRMKRGRVGCHEGTYVTGRKVGSTSGWV